MLEEIRSMGFDYAELSHGIRISLLPGIFDAVEAGVIKISTLHNFCPLPMGITHAAPNIYKFTSLDRRERENAYRHTLKTIETAERVGAKLIVLHMGCIDMKDYTDRLVDMLGDGLRESSKYEKLCREVVEKREAKKEKPSEAAAELLHMFEQEAGKRGIVLGIENREALEEIPFETDFNLLAILAPFVVAGLHLLWLGKKRVAQGIRTREIWIGYLATGAGVVGIALLFEKFLQDATGVIEEVSELTFAGLVLMLVLHYVLSWSKRAPSPGGQQPTNPSMTAGEHPASQAPSHS